MKIKSNVSRLAVLLAFIVVLFVGQTTSVAQDDTFNRDTNIGGTENGSCNICEEDYCGCDPGTFSIGLKLTSWDCTCSLHICEKHCNYS